MVQLSLNALLLLLQRLAGGLLSLGLLLKVSELGIQLLLLCFPLSCFLVKFIRSFIAHLYLIFHIFYLRLQLLNFIVQWRQNLDLLFLILPHLLRLLPHHTIMLIKFFLALLCQLSLLLSLCRDLWKQATGLLHLQSRLLKLLLLNGNLLC